MSLIFCEKCDGLFDSDFETDCPHCEVEETDVQVAPGIWQSKEDYEANMKFDEARDNEL